MTRPVDEVVPVLGDVAGDCPRRLIRDVHRNVQRTFRWSSSRDPAPTPRESHGPWAICLSLPQQRTRTLSSKVGPLMRATLMLRRMSEASGGQESESGPRVRPPVPVPVQLRLLVNGSAVLTAYGRLRSAGATSSGTSAMSGSSARKAAVTRASWTSDQDHPVRDLDRSAVREAADDLLGGRLGAASEQAVIADPADATAMTAPRPFSLRP